MFWNHTFWNHTLLGLAFTFFATTIFAQDAGVKIGSRLELFVDQTLVDSSRNIDFRLKEPRDAGIAISFNETWEGRFCGYSTVIKDGKRYLAYYRGMPEIGKPEVTCVAISEDGIRWKKPRLDLHQLGRQKSGTNIILANAGDVTHNFSPMLDENPKAEAQQKFKGIGGSAKSGLYAFASPDGIHWEKIQDEPVLKLNGWVFDSQNLAFWSESEGCYVMYFRRVVKGIRAIARSTSKDFINWTSPVQMKYSDVNSTIPRFHLYTNQTQPYFRAPHIYLATPGRFLPGRRAINAEQAKAIGVDKRYFGDISDAILMTSRGGNTYDIAYQRALLRPGIGAENWVSRTNYPALGIVPTGKHQMSWFVNQNYGQKTAHLRRYEFRIDGLASASADLSGGELTTKAIIKKGSDLVLNFATSAAGSVRVELQDANGKPIPGYELECCRPLIGNEIEYRVVWEESDSTHTLDGKSIRIRFELKDAELFSYQFKDGSR